MARHPYSSAFDEDDLADDVGYQQPSYSGLISIFAAMVGCSLLGIITILGIIMSDGQNVESTRVLVYCILAADFLAFVAGLVSLLSGIRSQSASNLVYRGWGLTGLIGSILILLISIFVGLAFTCIGLFVELVRNVPGG